MSTADRLTFALTNPLTGPDRESTNPYQAVERQPDGNLLMSILAVDR